jgi:hypothetical protein
MKRLWVKGHFESRLVGRSHTVQYGCSQRLASHGVVEVHVHFEAPGGQFHRCGGGGQGCRRRKIWSIFVDRRVTRSGRRGDVSGHSIPVCRVSY